jgi:hypothetical protein
MFRSKKTTGNMFPGSFYFMRLKQINRLVINNPHFVQCSYHYSSGDLE